MKYLQYAKGDVFINDNPKQGLESYAARFVGQPTYGKTTILIENEDRSKSKIYRPGKKLNPLNSPVKYTWKFEYYNGKPAIILNFSKIDLSKINGDYVICLEYRNMNRRVSNEVFFKNIGPKFNNHTRSTCFPGYEHNSLDRKISNSYYLKDLQCNKDYVLYITTFNNYDKNYRLSKLYTKYDDWECRLWVRPTIRGNFKKSLEFFASEKYNFKRLYIHCSKVPAESYKLCKFPYKDLK